MEGFFMSATYEIILFLLDLDFFYLKLLTLAVAHCAYALSCNII